jgi:hypothetical protein
MACHGKIARLPGAIRAQLNARLQRGDDGKNILAWLNSLPEAKSVFDAEFVGRPVTEQNLSDWRLGRYQEWLAQQEVLAQARDMADSQKELETVTPGESFADHLAAAVAFRYAAILAAQGAELDEKALRQLRALRPICQAALGLCRTRQNAARLRIERERWDMTRQEDLAAQEVARKFNERMERAAANKTSVKRPELQALLGKWDSVLEGLASLEELYQVEDPATSRRKGSSPKSGPKPRRRNQRPRRRARSGHPPASPTTQPAAASEVGPEPPASPQPVPREESSNPPPPLPPPIPSALPTAPLSAVAPAAGAEAEALSKAAVSAYPKLAAVLAAKRAVAEEAKARGERMARGEKVESIADAKEGLAPNRA